MNLKIQKMEVINTENENTNRRTSILLDEKHEQNGIF